MQRLKQLLKPIAILPNGNGARQEAGSREAARMILDFLGNAAITTDADGKIDYLNPRAEQLTGWSSNEACGQPVTHVIQMVNQATGQALDNPIRKALIQARTTPLANCVALLRRDGQQIATEGNAAPIFGSNGKLLGAILMLHDVSKSREMADKLAHQANHDVLTGLVNRREFEKRAERALDSARVQRFQHALCYMDLDQFKIVNDTCGHGAGDELLRRVAAVLQSHVRGRDTLARLGGDEFGLLLESCTLDDAERIAQEILLAIKNFRFEWEGKVFTIGVSIGVAAITTASADMATVLSTTDSACYAAKEKGRNRVQVYKDDDNELAERQREMRLVSRISGALDENRFALFFQPIVPLAGGVTGGDHFEILLRMVSPDKQLVAPDRFIPAAERYNLMPAVDRWVIQNALARYHQIYGTAEAKKRNTWAINISGTSLGSEGLTDFIREQCARYQVPPQSICFEITETAAIANINKAVDFIWGLKMDGFRFALDDFGKGMSSFSYLKNLPVNYLKIDGQFVKDILQDKISLGMVEAINRIGQLVGLETIAECVENMEHLNKLRELGVNYAQGYVISKPMPLVPRRS